MITINDFTKECNSYNHAYSYFVLLGTTMQDVVNAINKAFPDMSEWTVNNGEEAEGAVAFDLYRMDVNVLYELTEILGVTGYAGCCWDSVDFCAAKNGKPYDGFVAVWNEHYDRVEAGEDNETGEEHCWAAYFDVYDKETNMLVISAGGGCLEKEDEEYCADIVNSHTKDGVTKTMASINSR